MGELVYNDSGTGNPAFVGDYLLVTNEVASSYGIPCATDSGSVIEPSRSKWAVYALEEALERYAAEGGHCTDLDETQEGVVEFAHTSDSGAALERCSLPGVCERRADGWYGSISAKPEKMADDAAQQDLELQALLRAYMGAAMATW